MREWFLNWGRVLASAWNKQMLLPLPERFRQENSRKLDDREMAAFPLLGGCCALLVFLAALLGQLLFNRLGGALIFALSGWLFWLFHDHGRGDGLIADRLVSFLPGGEIPFRVVIPVFMMIMKFAMLMAIFFYGKGLLFTLVMGGLFAMEALLIKEAGFSPPVIGVSENAVQKFWTVLLILLAVNMPFSALGSAFSALFFAGLWRFSGQWIKREGCSKDDIRCYGAITGWLILLAGILAV